METSSVIVVASASEAEQLLLAGGIGCPECIATLRPHGPLTTRSWQSPAGGGGGRRRADRGAERVSGLNALRADLVGQSSPGARRPRAAAVGRIVHGRAEHGKDIAAGKADRPRWLRCPGRRPNIGFAAPEVTWTTR